MVSTSCKWCGNWQRGHTVDSCTYFESALKRNVLRAVKLKAKMESGGKRVCAYCASVDHASTKCPNKFYDTKAHLLKVKNQADAAFVWLHEIGFGPGAMLSGMATERGWSSGGKGEKIVVIENFTQRTFSNFMQELLNGDVRNWYFVDAVDTTNEKVKRIYLPYHEFYSPKPTSKKVSVIHRANEEDIESMKNMMDCYTNPIILYATAEEYFARGYKFKAGRN